MIKKNYISSFLPLYKEELKKILPLSAIFFCVSYNFSLLRGLKDIIILHEGGAMSIYYLKLFGVTPFLFILTIFYSLLSKTQGFRGRFNIIICYFLFFYLIFLVFMIPNLDYLKLEGLTYDLYFKYPHFSPLWSIIKNWHTSLFYVHAEAWGNFMLGVIIWSLANEITLLSQSKRFYGFFSISTNLGSMVAGLALSKIFKAHLKYSITSIIAVGLLSIFFFNFLCISIEKNPSSYQVNNDHKPSIKIKNSFFSSVKYIARSKYLMTIAFLVFSYGFVISSFEGVWKENMRLHIGKNHGLMANIYGMQLFYIGLISIILTVSLNKFLIKKNWKVSAMITPIIFIASSIIFFSFLLFGNKMSFLKGIFSSSPAGIATVIGLMNVVFVKATKYSFFDTSKEAAYIPLDEECKIRGKAAIDGNGQILGKSMGGLMLTIFSILGEGSIASFQFPIAIIIIFIAVLWVMATNSLGTLFNKKTEKNLEVKSFN